MQKKTENRVRRTLVVLGAAVAIAALSACNTVSGVGKDLQESSQNVKKAIEN